MTLESEVLGILRKYGIGHISAFVEGESVKVRELLSEWKKEHFRMPADLRSLIEGVCE